MYLRLLYSSVYECAAVVAVRFYLVLSLLWLYSWILKLAPKSQTLLLDFIWSAQELEKDTNGPGADSVPTEKKLAIFDKIFAAYSEARSCIRNDLVSWALVMKFLFTVCTFYENSFMNYGGGILAEGIFFLKEKET